MIGSALRYPLDASRGRRHLLGTTGALLATAIALRIAVDLYPLVVSLVPGSIAFLAAVVAMGTLSAAFLEPDGPVPDVRSLLWRGVVATVVAVATLGFPVALLFWTVLSYGTGDGAAQELGIFFLVGSTTAFVTFLAATYLVPVLVARAVDSGRVWGIADWRQLRVALTEIAYLQGWSLGIGLAILGWWAVITGLTSTNLTGLLAIVGGAYCLLASVRVVGKGYASVPGVELPN